MGSGANESREQEASNDTGANWSLELVGHPFDLKDLAETFEKGRFQVVVRKDKYYLQASELNELEGAGEVRRRGEELVAVMNGLAKLKSPGFSSVRVGVVERWDREGGRNIFVHAGGSIRVRGHVSAVVTRADGTVEPVEDRRRLSSERRAEIARNTTVAKALMLLGQEATWHSLYKVYEIVKHDVGDQPSMIVKKGWAESLDEVTTFTRTANWHETEGARHAVPKKKPPRNPMSLKEAEDFVRRLVGCWLNEM